MRITLSEDGRPQIVRFPVPTQLSLQDPNTFTALRVEELRPTVLTFYGTPQKFQPEELSPKYSFARIRRWEATHSDKTISKDEGQKAVDEYRPTPKEIDFTVP